MRSGRVRDLAGFIVLVLAANAAFPASKENKSPAEELPAYIRQVTYFGERADWSHDGKRLLFLEKTFGDAYEVELATGIIRPVTTRYFHEGYTRALYLSNGDILLSGARTFDAADPWASRSEKNAELWVLKKDRSGPPTPLGVKCSEGPAVSRKNLRIAWTCGGAIQVADIVYDEGAPRLTNVKKVLDEKDLPFKCNVETQNFRPPQEKELTFSAYGYQGTEVMGLDLETGKVVNYSNAPGQYDEPEGIFPDGRYTLVECDRHNRMGSQHIDLYKLALDGSGRTERITHFSDYPGYKASNPVVSDDGRYIAFQFAKVGDPAGVGRGLFVLDLVGYEKERTDAAIRSVRLGTLVIEAAPSVDVRVEQVRHEFWFGAALASQAFGGWMNAQDAARYKQVFLENFNAAVTENALKWHSMEPRQGQVDYSIVDAILQWTDEHEIPLRGHNIFWGIPNRVQPWLKAMDDATLRRTLEARALDVGKRYKGRFAQYDLNNEMLHANYYEDRLGPGITRDMALWVRQEDPHAVLFLNDYDILTGRRLDDYIAHIRRFLDQGVPIGGIGVQGHLHGDSFDPDTLKVALDRLAEFGLPICITEFNFPGQRSKYSGKRGVRLSDQEEQAKAQAIVDYYRICFANPAVKGILMWGFWEGANWIPVSSLYRRDWSPTPAAEAYRDLVFQQWWTTWQGRTDARGWCEVPAFYGRYRVTAGGQEQVVSLKRSEQRRTVSFR